jgi:hypothetical protein
MSILDLWTGPNQWLTLHEIQGRMALARTDKANYFMIAKSLHQFVRNGHMRRRHTHDKTRMGIPLSSVYEYSPKPSLLYTLCDGFYQAHLKALGLSEENKK